jgi:hypothetical protein
LCSSHCFLFGFSLSFVHPNTLFAISDTPSFSNDMVCLRLSKQSLLNYPEFPFHWDLAWNMLILFFSFLFLFIKIIKVTNNFDNLFI